MTRRFKVTLPDKMLPSVDSVIARVPAGSEEGLAHLTECKRRAIWLLNKNIHDTYSLIRKIHDLKLADIPEVKPDHDSVAGQQD